MKKIIKAGLLFFLLIIIYAIAWYAAALHLCKAINNLKEDKITFDLAIHPIEVNFDKVVPYGFPFKFGIRFINLTEESKEPITRQKYTILHKGFVSISYDLFKQGVVFSNKGESIVKIKPLSSGFGTRVISDNSFFIKLPLSFKLLSKFNNDDAAFEVINFIQSMELAANNVQAYDLIDSRQLLSQEVTKLAFSWEAPKYYLNFEDFKNNIPNKYFVDLKMEISQSADDRKIIAPMSLVYFVLGNGSFKTAANLNLETKAKTFDLEQIINQMQLKIANFTFTNGLVDAKVTSEIKSNNQSQQENCDFEVDASLALTDLISLKPKLVQIKESLSNIYDLSILDTNHFLDDLLANSYAFKFLSQGNYSFGKNIKNLNLDSLYLMLNDDVAINLKGHSSFASIRNWYLDGNILIYNFEKIVDSMANFLIKYMNYDVSILSAKKEAFKLLLRGVSSYPGSNSQDLSINMQLSHNLGASTIGSIPLQVFLSNYQKAIEKNYK